MYDLAGEIDILDDHYMRCIDMCGPVMHIPLKLTLFMHLDRLEMGYCDIMALQSSLAVNVLRKKILSSTRKVPGICPLLSKGIQLNSKTPILFI